MNSQNVSDISIMMAGNAGDGILFTGNVLAKILKGHGWEVATYRDFPSNIRGEATNYTIRASLRPVHGRGDYLDILMAFDCESIFRHVRFLREDGIVLCEGDELYELAEKDKGRKTFHKFHMRKIAKEKFGNEIFKNMISLGGLCHILKLDVSVVEEVIANLFLAKKGKEVVRKNIEAVHLGCSQAERMISDKELLPLAKKKDKGKLFLSGDEAIAFGALAAGCRFFAAYPICPASEIWQWLAVQFPSFHGLVVQTEDELAAINMALGASYAGVRAMTSTSGPGASLMMEGFSLAGMTEIPLVIVHVQRTGPSTGMPTKTEQADLTQWIFGSHGDFPRIVLSPGTFEECFEMTVEAFNLADKYQCPVVLLTEQDYGQNFQTVKEFDISKVSIDRGKLLSQKELLSLREYKRYAFAADGISPRALPSMKNGLHMVESNEHDEKGYRNEEPENRMKMMEKRMRKLEIARKDIPAPKLWGERNAEVGIVGCGSTFGPIQEAMLQLRSLGIKAKHLQLRTLWPFLENRVNKFLQGCKKVFVVENNFTGQLRSLLKSQTSGNTSLIPILKYSSQSFRPNEISGKIKGHIK